MIELINLPKFEDPRGTLIFIEQNTHIPIEIKRAYWIYDVPGGNAFRNSKECIQTQ